MEGELEQLPVTSAQRAPPPFSLWGTLRSLAPYFLSHHPSCRRFDDHVWLPVTMRVCLGCSTLYPFAILTLVFMVLIDPWEPYRTGLLLPLVPVVVGTGLAFLQLLRLRDLPGGRPTHFVLKALVGIGFGLALAGTVQLPLPRWTILTLLVLAGAAIGIAGFLRIFYIRRTCKGCHYGGDWDVCPGWSGVSTWQPGDGPSGREV